LLEWFLAQPSGGTLQGYSHHAWNGVTTLQYARFCEDIILRDRFEVLRNANHTLHYLPNETVSKYELLKLFAEVYGRKQRIEMVSGPGPAVDRTLASVYLKLPLSPMREALETLKSYCDQGCFAHAAP
jgi:dTDP-4-dehydrorhamnose reductase